jgi:hypothetical protein
MNSYDPGSMQDRPDVIDGELQLDELELLSDRQAENFVGGFVFATAFKFLLRRTVPGFPTTFPVLNIGNVFISTAPL